MASYNKVVLIGRLTNDPELRYTQGGSAICSFGLAVSRVYGKGDEKKEQTCFVDIKVWGKLAEATNTYCKKGKEVLVEGRLDYQTWEDKTTGAKRSKLEVVTEQIHFLSGGKSKDSEPEPMGAGERRSSKRPTDEIDDSSIPF